MICILIRKIILILANSADLNKALHSGAFHLGFTVCQSIPVIRLINHVNSSPTYCYLLIFLCKQYGPRSGLTKCQS